MNETPPLRIESSRANRSLMFFLTHLQRHFSFLLKSSTPSTESEKPSTRIYPLKSGWEWEKPLWDEPNYKQEMMAGNTSVPYTVDSDY